MTIRAADLLARRLHQAGCRRAFGMPGGEVLTIVDALCKAGIEFILCHHENAGGFMSEGGHHVDGAPAILVATVGPGVMNAVNVVANAEQDRVPLIVLSGCIDADEAETYTHQLLDHRAVLDPITKATFTLTPGAAAVQADKAVRIAMAPRAGPVLVDVPISVADAPVEDDSIALPPTAPGAIGADALRQAREWLEQAERPIMLAGLDAVRDRAGPTIRAFCETHSVPLVTTYKGKGLMPEGHSLCLGGAGLSPLADRHLLPLFRDADLVILAGYDPIEMRVGWRNVWDAGTQRVIDICDAPNTHGMHAASLEVVAPVGDTLSRLSDGVTGQETWPDDAPAMARLALREAFSAREWGPDAVIATCRDVCPPGTIATVDSGAHRILLSQMWECEAPGLLLQSTGLCTMGCALPLALGAKRAAPDTPVVAFMGDGGFLMVAGELASAVALKVPVVAVVFVDASLALIEMKQRQRQLSNAGVDFDRLDHAAVARAFGGRGVRVADADALRGAMEDALAHPGFTLIAAEIDRKAYDGRI
ncbi:thiamine pyrophosphate-binding protein [Jannaschia aquimarina]|uniref:BudB protein n=1 Tax=Jannaschia aquimarina TaxID=935700 RepID=A0A0D1D778_9RHOB|nr:thiamine pyrophosphate-binding protein [Jannaschia aquimarina]KIT15793.1 Acetolactate synthase, catabolic [Jannaschia aquimarina]SNT42936.1 acetolactate synthase-1/2/3 large subunit [Jannaschia aquimarina]